MVRASGAADDDACHLAHECAISEPPGLLDPGTARLACGGISVLRQREILSRTFS